MISAEVLRELLRCPRHIIHKQDWKSHRRNMTDDGLQLLVFGFPTTCDIFLSLRYQILL